MMGAVSPAALATPMISPVKTPGRAEGITTFFTVCHLLAPRATLPSLREFGTLLSASWLVRIMVGRFISPRIIDPARRDIPTVDTRKARPKRP